jgi:hypothetical protein
MKRNLNLHQFMSWLCCHPRNAVLPPYIFPVSNFNFHTPQRFLDLFYISRLQAKNPLLAGARQSEGHKQANSPQPIASK